jgi:hypothetical protein
VRRAAVEAGGSRVTIAGIVLPIVPRSEPAVTKRRLLTLGRLTLVCGLAIPLLGLLPELIYLTPDLNDGAFHLGVARNTIAAVGEGLNPLDFWVPTWLSGFPLFQYYQPGPYLLLAALHFLCGGAVPLLRLYRLVTLLAVVLFPPANYLALRWLRLPRATAGWGALLSCAVAAHATYGIEMESFTWSGWGLFAQAMALPLLPLALAGGWRALHDRGRTLGYAAILAGAFLTHILYGYIAALSLAVVPFLLPHPALVKRGIIGLSRFYVQVMALIAFFVVPLALHLPYHAKSLYDEAAKFDSYGAAVILNRLFSGALLDYNRLPVMTCLAAAGMYLCARQWLQRGSALHGWISCGFVLWVLLYFGRPTWGALVDLLPMSHGLHLERLSSGVHIFAIWLAAIALGRVSRWCLGYESRPVRYTLLLGMGVLVAPVLAERARYFVYNTQQVLKGKRMFDRDAAQFEPVLQALRARPGRVYAGHSGNWGKSYTVGEVQVYHLLSAEAISQVANAPYSWALSTDFQIQLQWPDQATYDLYDTRYLLTDQALPPPPGAELVVQSGRHRLYRLHAEGPFDIVSVPLAIAATKDTVWYMMMSWAKGPWVRQHAHARLLLAGEAAGGLPVIRMEDRFRFVAPGAQTDRNVFDPPGVFVQPAPPPARGTVQDVTQSRQEASATLTMESPGVVLFKTTYHPDWRAWVDGAPASTVVLTPGLIGVPVPAGAHHLSLAYRPGWSKVVLLVLGVGLAVLMDRRRERHGPAG